MAVVMSTMRTVYIMTVKRNLGILNCALRREKEYEKRDFKEYGDCCWSNFIPELCPIEDMRLLYLALIIVLLWLYWRGDK